MRLRRRIAVEVAEIYQEFIQLPPAMWLALSCLALLLACTVAFGLHP